VVAIVSGIFEYSQPLVVESPEDCYFYHRFDLPGLGTVGGDWDLRSCIDAYLGNYRFSGKRVLDVGTASGFLTFEMEKRGATVVSFDMEDGGQWNVVPHFRAQDALQKTLDAIRRGHQRLKNAYWFCHRHLGSGAQAYYGDIYNLPVDLGHFDVALFGMILSHLRDPFQALYSASRLADAVIVTNQVWKSATPMMTFLPDPADSRELRAWWSFSDRCIERMLGTLGFEVEYVTSSEPRCLARGFEGHRRCTAFVARRVSRPGAFAPAPRYGVAQLALDRLRTIRRLVGRSVKGARV
jgi:SAM-dependent methyltransferase